ncbi:hypothetical protein LRD18_00690 [Halorhodospira halochloris]|uniref:hypothetical protein n=1 Tax=Halorhodospira halochloris TaxID=1052 RepID=UPI001EE875F0|nr:hypothetical protein [Halorhodospira halochloris]MCG5529389.1 hypothetical protein [Halorhodospira halochloris]
MELVGILSIGAGLYGGYKGHQAKEAIKAAIEDQTELLRGQMLLVSASVQGKDDCADGCGRYIDDFV